MASGCCRRLCSSSCTSPRVPEPPPLHAPFIIGMPEPAAWLGDPGAELFFGDPSGDMLKMSGPTSMSGPSNSTRPENMSSVERSIGCSWWFTGWFAYNDDVMVIRYSLLNYAWSELIITVHYVPSRVVTVKSGPMVTRREAQRVLKHVTSRTTGHNQALLQAWFRKI